MSSSDQKCYFCGEIAQIQNQGAHFVRCNYCGDYVVSWPCEGIIEQIKPSDRLKISCVLMERKIAHKGGALDQLFFTSSKHESPPSGRILVTPDEILSRFPRSAIEIFDRALLNLSEEIDHPATSITFGPKDGAMVFAPDNLASMLVQLQNVGYLVGIEGRSGYFVTGKGWERIAELRKPGRDSNHAFVAMWFDDSRTNSIRPTGDLLVGGAETL